MKIYLSNIENIRMNFKHLRNYQTSFPLNYPELKT